VAIRVFKPSKSHCQQKCQQIHLLILARWCAVPFFWGMLKSPVFLAAARWNLVLDDSFWRIL